MTGRAQSYQIQRQTTQIIKCLFADDDDDDRVCFHQFYTADVETDGPMGEEETFDPVPIADKLKEVAESLNQDAKFKAALDDLKLALGKEVAVEAFTCKVNALVQTQISQQAFDVAPEMQLIKICFAFGLFVKKSYPELKNKAQSAVSTLLNNSRVVTWVTQQGGWEKVRQDIEDI
ncbi:uncharacterized protein LOC144024014 [Festucalex cinctus]